MKFESFFRPKPKEELEKQVQSVEAENDIKLTHESMEDEVGLLDVAELKEKYKVRYDAYLEMLRAERQGDDLQESDFYKAKVLINALNNLDDYIVAQERGEHRVLRGRQIPVFNEIRDALERGVDAGYVHLPTGVGKTVLFTQLIEATKLKSLIGVPSLPLVKNTVEEIEKRTTKSIGEYTGKRKDTSQDITTITYPSLINAVREGKIEKEEFPLIILDEAHKALGPETEKAISSLSGIKIGFTATPEYSPDRGVDKLLPEEIYTMSLREAIQEGLSCRTKTIHAYTEVDLSSVSVKNGRYNDEELEKVLNVKGRNMAALELYKNKFSHLKAMINCSGIEHSKAVAKLFQEQGIKAAHIDGTMSDTERDLIIKKLKSGEITVITNAKLLLEGFDEQSLSVALNLAPTLSFVNAEQRGGRPLRVEEGNPDKWAYVVDFIDKNAKKNQVLFSEILEGDKIVPIEEEEIETVNKRKIEKKELKQEPPINFDDLNIDGLRVVVNSQEILSVTQEFENSREFSGKWTYSGIREEVLKKGIKTTGKYLGARKENQWSMLETVISMPEFPKNADGSNDWDTFFNREEFDFETFRQDVIAKGIKTSTEYQKKQKDNKWPYFGTLTDMPEFPKNTDGSNNWDEFLGREKKKEWQYEDFRKAVIDAGITSAHAYGKKSSKYNWPSLYSISSIPQFPKNPDGSPDWGMFLGVEGRKNWKFEDLQEDVRIKGIKTASQYSRAYKDFRWPSSPTLLLMPEFPKNPDGSSDWSAFLGTEKRKEWTYETLRQDVILKGVKSTDDYRKNQQENKNNWPSPRTLLSMSEFPKNSDGSNDWDTFFGKEKRKEWTYEAIHKEVLDKQIKNFRAYANRKTREGWPTVDKLIALPEFPKNADGSSDWNTFFKTEKRKEWTYDELRKEMISRGIKSSGEYMKYQRDNQWPVFTTLVSMSEFPKNSDGSNDWDTFLGKEKFDFSSFWREVRLRGPRSIREYREIRKNNGNWPHDSVLVKSSEFPRTLDGKPDWKTFFDPNK